MSEFSFEQDDSQGFRLMFVYVYMVRKDLLLYRCLCSKSTIQLTGLACYICVFESKGN
jgi:hypothetical protein